MQLGIEVVLAAHEHLVDAPPGAVVDRPDDPGILDPPVQREGDDKPGTTWPAPREPDTRDRYEARLLRQDLDVTESAEEIDEPAGELEGPGL